MIPRPPVLLMITILAPWLEITAADATRPNILIVLANDMGWSDLRCHGNDRLDTPAIDHLKRQSVELDCFYVSPLYSPTRSSLLTSRHHLRLGVLSTTGGLGVMQGDEISIAEGLTPAICATGCFGKWNNGSHRPSTARGHGNDEFFDFNRGFQSNYFGAELEQNESPVATKGFITDVLTDAALTFMRRVKDRPFSYYAPFNACHSPMQAPQALFTKYCGWGFDPSDAAICAMIEDLDASFTCAALSPHSSSFFRPSNSRFP